MANDKDKNTTKPTNPISAAELLIKAQATPSTINSKGQTPPTKLKSENDLSFQKTMSNIVDQTSDDTNNKQLKFLSWIQDIKGPMLKLFSFDFDVEEPKVLTATDLETKGVLTQGEIFNANTADKKIADIKVVEAINDDGTRSYYTGKVREDFITSHTKKQEQNHKIENSTERLNPSISNHPRHDVISYKDTNVGNIKKDISDAIKFASDVTGVPQSILIEAGSGNIPSLSSDKRAASLQQQVRNVWQQDDRYFAKDLKDPEKVAFLAKHVPEALEYSKDGKFSEKEIKSLVSNPKSAAILVALRTKDLSNDIKTVSQMYASEAGMSQKDLAKVIGGIAHIESKGGILRSVVAKDIESSAGGAFHYLNGTIKGEVLQSLNDPRIANRVNELNPHISKQTKAKDISTEDAWELKEDNILVGSLVAKNVIKALQKHPELKNDVNALTTYVYQSHNLGEGGATALARGGREALEKASPLADNNNPQFFRGAKSDEEVNSRYNKFVSNAIASASPLIDTAFAGEPKTLVATVVNKNSHPTRAPHPA